MSDYSKCDGGVPEICQKQHHTEPGRTSRRYAWQPVSPAGMWCSAEYGQVLYGGRPGFTRQRPEVRNLPRPPGNDGSDPVWRMLRHELGEVRSTCPTTRPSPLKLGSCRAAAGGRLARAWRASTSARRRERTVPVARHLAGVGRPAACGGAPGTRPRTCAPWPPVTVSTEPVGTRCPRAGRITPNSIEVIRPVASWAYASGQRKRRLDGHLVGPHC
jgi:hypothetical protein